ncbi:gamma-interferon-responsive lysosomal thiol protein-like [Papaver somniferum]|uniref:gamma-interferon-responsive lysosomal thiol protein-like n=1 Tax=Papaver somniferum TaxID=3469 RepID=UPI000E6FF7C6|nr:gamma-interferon-responsive lysosomal thiol protein-like [Papaver somniferum]
MMTSSSFTLVSSLMILLVSSTQNLSSVAVVVASALPAPKPDFIVKNFPKIISSGITDIMDLKLVPYGNAFVENNTIICQHGSEECFLNQVEACAIHAWPDVENSCERFSCLKKPGFSAKPIVECISSGLGLKTYGNLVKAVCNAYKAATLPRVCQEHTADINPEAKSNSNQEVCYVDEASPTAKVRPPVTRWRRLLKF